MKFHDNITYYYNIIYIDKNENSGCITEFCEER